MTLFSRRQAITLGSAALAAGASGLIAQPAFALGPSPTRKRVLRFAHVTDIHVQPELKAGEGFSKCLQHVQSLPDPPTLIVFGGDEIMDSFEQGDTRTTLLWNLWHSIVKSELSLPWKACIGNHDVWGWMKSKSHLTGNESLYGKKRAIKELGIPDRYYSFDQAGWRFYILDSIHPDLVESYRGQFDDEQLAWLDNDLSKLDPKTPVVVVSHIPILSTLGFVEDKVESDGNYHVSGGLVHGDYVKVKEIFKKHPNVKLCLSGHVHLIDRAEYLGVTYLCNGAVSAGWWRGPNYGECDEGYAVIDLYDDGSFEHQYVRYGWKAAA